MAYQNQHSHIFLVDLTSLGEAKYNRGVRRLPGALKECLDLAVVSSQTLIQCVGIIMTSPTEVSTLLPLNPVGNSITKAVQMAASKIEGGLVKATAFGDKEKGRENLKSALVQALANLEGLGHPLELHLVTTLSISEVDILLTRAKARVGRVTRLKPVNIISPLPEHHRPAETVLVSNVFTRKFFTDELDLEALLRSALLCQPGDLAHLTLHFSDTERLSLDLQLRCVVRTRPRPKTRKHKPQVSTFGPRDLDVEGTVLTSGVCQSLLKGIPTLAVPTAALSLSRLLKKRNQRKVRSLHKELLGERTSLMVTCDDTDKAYILSAVSDPEAGEITPAFLLSQVVTTDTLLPLAKSDTSQDSQDMNEKMRRLVSKLPHQDYYNPLHHTRTINLNTTKARGKFRKK